MVLCTLYRFALVIWCLISRWWWFWVLFHSGILWNWSGVYEVPLAFWDFSTIFTSSTSFFHGAKFLTPLIKIACLRASGSSSNIGKSYFQVWECPRTRLFLLSHCNEVACHYHLCPGLFCNTTAGWHPRPKTWGTRKKFSLVISLERCVIPAKKRSMVLVANVWFVLTLAKICSRMMLHCLMRLRLD